MITRYQNYFFILPTTLSVLAIISIIVWDLKPGIDLTGGSLLQVSYTNERPDAETVRALVSELGYGQILVQPTAESDYLLRQRALSLEEKNALVVALGEKGE